MENVNLNNLSQEEKERHILSLIKNKKTREKGYALLISEFSGRIYWQIRRMVYSHEDTDDLVQEVFIKVFENIETFNKKSKLSTWIFSIAYNHTLNFLKSKTYRNSKKNSSFEQNVLSSLAEDGLFDADKATLALEKAVLSLPVKQRAVFQMRYYQDLSFAQIAQITKTSEGALKASYHIAAEKIEKLVLQESNI